MEASATPMLRQYHDIKARYQDCIVFFRLGDFYEMFYDDAVTSSSILDLVLTSRGHEASGKVPMCGVPFHAADNYIGKLVKAGKKVAICEQVPDNGPADTAKPKGLFKRDVIRVITAGTYLDDSTDSRCLLCLAPGNKGTLGFAFADTTGGTIRTNILNSTQLAVELLSRLPVFECIYPESAEDAVKALLAHPLLKPRQILLSPYQDWCFNPDIAKKELSTHFGVLNLHGFGIEDMKEAQSACGALLEYLRSVNKTPLKHIDRISLYTKDDYAFISPAAHYGLELEHILSVLDATQTPMGRRSLRFWLHHPLKNAAQIAERQSAVRLLHDHPHIAAKLNDLLKSLPDLEKALTRVSCGCGTVKDLLALRQGLLRAPMITEALQPLEHPLFTIVDIPSLRERLTAAIDPNVPLGKPEGKTVAAGIDADLDALRGIQENGRQWLAAFQAREIKATGISSLKVGFNNVFGYYIEITKTHQKSAPAHYIRRQTLVNGERYITPELKEYEEKILTAQDKIFAIEKRILGELERDILSAAAALHRYSEALAMADYLLSLSTLFARGTYVLPDVNDGHVIDIRDGRHPMVEQTIGDAFTPNDTLLDTQDNHLIILTGPNMAGKSTYIRQTALLVIMAQMGAPIPASSAVIGLVDKIFTRIGAHDEIAKGQSTFMVEMTETAHILNNLSPRSLVILDEIGRGTSTSDGLSLAWALAEHLHKAKTRTLFATHFHELVNLAGRLPGIKNYNVAVKEWKDKIIFLHKIIPGGSDDSYGIYVAKLAGIPDGVIKRSKEILSELEIGTPNPHHMPGKQLNLFAPASDQSLEEVRAMIEQVDVNATTPLDALKLLNDIKQKLS